MERIAQELDDIVASLRPLIVEWKDETACRVIDRLKGMPSKSIYTAGDLKALLDDGFDDGMLIFRLFRGSPKISLYRYCAGFAGKPASGSKAIMLTKISSSEICFQWGFSRLWRRKPTANFTGAMFWWSV
jgi:hypothetical protein